MYNHILAHMDQWFSVPDASQQFLVTSLPYKFENCSNVCNNSSGSLAPFLPEALLSVMNTTQEYGTGCWVINPDTDACIRLFRPSSNSIVGFMRPIGCGGKGHCVCWNGTLDSHKPNTVKLTTVTKSTSTQQAATTTVSTPDINETNPFTNMKREVLNNWTMYDLQELYINTDKTSHDNASRFCHDELNSTLVTVLNPLEYLRLLKTMELKTGIFWIGK